MTNADATPKIRDLRLSTTSFTSGRSRPGVRSGRSQDEYLRLDLLWALLLYSSRRPLPLVRSSFALGAHHALLLPSWARGRQLGRA